MTTASEIPDERADRLPVWRDDGRGLQINEIFYSIEGAGLRVGQPTTFVRLARCNLRCHFCDTEFDRYTEMELKYVVGKAFREDRVEEDRADYIYLQPESSEPRFVQKALEILTRHPRWRLSTRIHKTLGLP